MVTALIGLLACGTTPSTPTLSTPVERPAPSSEALDLDKTIDRLDKALAADPTDVVQRIQLAHTLRMAGRITDAEQAYRRATVDSPDEVIGHLALGELLRTEGRCAEALEPLNRASVLAPTSPTPWEHLAVCHLELDDLAQARQALDRAEALGSEDAELIRGSMR